MNDRPLGGAFVRLWTASAASNFGDGLARIAFPVIAATLTDSPALVGGVNFALTLPWALVSLPLGVVIDRRDRRVMMITANASRLGALIVASGIAAAGYFSIWWLYVVALVVGICEVLYDTSAQTILPDVIHPAQLERGNSRLYAAELVMNQFIGPPVGGLLVGMSVAMAMLGSALSYGFGVAALLLMVSKNYGPIAFSGDRSVATDVHQGVLYLLQNRLLWRIAMIGAVANLAWSAWETAFVLFALRDSGLGLSEVEYGWLRSVSAVGGAIGAVVADRAVARLGPSRTLLVTVLGWVLFLAGPVLSSSVVLVGSFLFVGSISGAVFSILIVSLRQRISDKKLLGRVNATFRMLTWGALPVGAGVGGVIGELFGIRTVFFGTTLMTLALLPIVRVSLWSLNSSKPDSTHPTDLG